MGFGYWVTRAVLSVKAPFRGNKQQNRDLNQGSVKLSLSLSLSPLSVALFYLIGTRSRSKSVAVNEAERKLKVSKYYKGEKVNRFCLDFLIRMLQARNPS